MLGLLTSLAKDVPGAQSVGIDLHRRRSVIVRMEDEGETLESIRIVNDPERLRSVLARADKPLDDPRLRMMAQVGEADGQLDWFAAWLWTSNTLR